MSIHVPRRRRLSSYSSRVIRYLLLCCIVSYGDLSDTVVLVGYDWSRRLGGRVDSGY